ncbi:MAG: SPW repeat protein [Candidatus Levyibacteriota bacterium]
MYWITGILGLALAVAPWVLNYTGNGVALWSSVILGGLTVIASLIEGAQHDRAAWEYWAAGILGILAIISPFALGFSAYSTAMWTTVVLGVLIAIFAGSRLGSGNWRKTSEA